MAQLRPGDDGVRAAADGVGRLRARIPQREHRSLVGLDAATLRRELLDSGSALEDMCQVHVPYFAYPFGHHDSRVRDSVVDAGYAAAFTFVNGRLTPDLDVTRLPRMTMHNGLRRLRLALQLARPPSNWPNTQDDMVGDRS
ncbi:MAG: polysaccharide deacetylase family protein [Acidimicrobiales bacterium]